MIEVPFTRHKTIASAKRHAPNFAYNPCIVRLVGGGYDSFPHGHPLPPGAMIILCTGYTATGRPVWKEWKEKKQ